MKLNRSDFIRLYNQPIYVIKDSNLSLVEEAKTDNYSTKLSENREIIGRMEKGILIITDEKQMTSEDETFLMKGLTALDVGKEDIGVFNHHEGKIDWKNLNGVNRVIWFRQQPEEQKLYKVHQENERKILIAGPMESIRTNQELKVRFWKALKLLFDQN